YHHSRKLRRIHGRRKEGLCKGALVQRPSTRTIPTPDEVAPWGDAIATLWNDDIYAQTLVRAASERLERYSFQNVAAQTAAFFDDVASQ
ncbi:MAG: hypothetical protein IJO46_03850, partial [Thermoguttaceae bacterium]|nr:hypothetical protein [Thermoguttaceae bacterium]